MQHNKKPNTKPSTRRDKKQITLVLPAKPIPAAAAPVSPTPPRPASDAPAKVDRTAIASQIADELGEVKPWPRRQIKRIVGALGDEQAQDLVKRALAIEAAGGMLITSGQRRRTLGGIYFHLAYTEGKPLEGKKLTRPDWNPGRKKPAPASSDNVSSCSHGIHTEVTDGSGH